MKNNLKNSIKKIFFINIIIVICLLITLEVFARIYISITRGNSTAGLVERNLNLAYQPYTMYGPNWTQIYKKFSEDSKNEEGFKVLLIGGSTAQGFPVEILEKKISAATKKKVKVYNSAYGGYISTQELILTTRYANIINPDLIINLNTANDILHSIRKNNLAGTFFLNNTYESILTKPYLAPFVYMLQQSQLFNGLVRLKARNNQFNINNYRGHIDILIQNMNNIYLFCKGSNILYLNVMQPHVIFKNIKHENEKQFKAFDFRTKIVRELYDLTREKILLNEESFLDTRFIYNDNPAHIFSDDVHFIDDKGYDILANSIAKKISIILNKEKY